MITLSSEIFVKEKNADGGGGLPVTVGLDQHPAGKQHSLTTVAIITLHVLYSHMYMYMFMCDNIISPIPQPELLYTSSTSMMHNVMCVFT